MADAYHAITVIFIGRRQKQGKRRSELKERKSLEKEKKVKKCSLGKRRGKTVFCLIQMSVTQALRETPALGCLRVSGNISSPEQDLPVSYVSC